MTSVVVVGAGIIGLAAARELARRGATVTVVERHLAGAGTSSRGEGNMLVSDKEIPAEARLALRSLELWRAFAAESVEAFEYEPKGGLITASTTAQLDLLAAQAARQRELGIDSTVLTTAEVRAREPGLAEGLAGGIWFPQDAQVMPIHAVRALRRAALDLGVTERTGVEVVGLDAGRGRSGVALQLSDGSTLTADAVVLAAGPWSGALAARLGGTAPVFPRRGLLLVTEPLPQGTVRHKVYDGRYVEAVASDDAEAQVAPVVESTASGTILIGSTREAVGWDTAVRWDLAGGLARNAATLFPDLAGAQVIRTYQGFRPATPDHLPLIGPDAQVAGLFHCTGHEGAGIGLALGSAEVLADAVLSDRVEPAFDPRRFDDAPPDRVGTSTVTVDVPPQLRSDGAASGDVPGVPDGGVVAGGSTVAAALLAQGRQSWRTTRFGDRPRGLFCGIGHCHDCVIRDAGGRTVRACLEPAGPRAAEVPDAQVDDAQVDEAQVDGARAVVVDVVVVGAGPGGLATAGAAAAAGLRVAVLDRYDRAGGQIGRQPAGSPVATGPWADLIVEGTGRPTHLADTSVVALRPLGAGTGSRFEAIVSRGGQVGTVLADHVVLATGAREVVAPFPGWTLPGVVTAGALQALVKREGTSPWRRVGLAGSGPLLLAVADAVRRAGTRPVFLLEQRSIRQLARGGLPLAVRQPGKAALFAKLAGPHPPRFGWRVVEAVGGPSDPGAAGGADAVGDRLHAAVIADARGRSRTVALDALAVSGGLVPDMTLAVQLGCATRAVPGGAGPAVVVDDRQRTSVEGVLAVGEVTGVGGADKAVAEGRLAGAVLAMAAGGDAAPDDLRADADRWRSFADALALLYPWQQGWATELPDSELVCRCEEVPIGVVRRAIGDGATTARAVKGLTRCGMGLCQGGVCGPLLSTALRAAGHDEPGDLELRPLATPLPLDQLARITR